MMTDNKLAIIILRSFCLQKVPSTCFVTHSEQTEVSILHIMKKHRSQHIPFFFQLATKVNVSISRQFLGKQQIKCIIDRAAHLLLLPAVCLCRKSRYDNNIIASIYGFTVLFISVMFVHVTQRERQHNVLEQRLCPVGI